jgi:hypothetical protein
MKQRFVFNHQLHHVDDFKALKSTVEALGSNWIKHWVFFEGEIVQASSAEDLSNLIQI